MCSAAFDSPTSALGAWAEPHGVVFSGVRVASIPGKGLGLVATRHIADEEHLLIRVPKNLILGLDAVRTMAKSDRHLREVLEAAGMYARVSSSSVGKKRAPFSPPAPPSALSFVVLHMGGLCLLRRFTAV